MVSLGITLKDMMAARDKRAMRQTYLLDKHKVALISFTLNIAGPKKRFPMGDRCFHEGVLSILALLKQHRFNVLEDIQTDAPTGLECLWSVSAPARTLKEIFATLEEEHPLGRLFDIDILSERGKIDRGEVGLRERGCLICGQSGVVCSRSRAHNIEELEQKTKTILEDFFIEKDGRVIAGIAVQALLYELSVTPKPGLVDRQNNGSHSDMNFFTFIDSATALFPYFYKMYVIGAMNAEISKDQILYKLRAEGIRAEHLMEEATGGVNTHKGAIFSLGIISAACGYLGVPLPSYDIILTCASEIASPALEQDFTHLKNIQKKTPQTHGEAIFLNYGITGIRGEAAKGFPSVRTYGIPALKHALEKGASINDAGVEALLHMMTHVDDTNIISRGGLKMLDEIQNRLDDISVAKAIELDDWLIKENISPGGCADLLAVTYMMYLLEKF